MTTLNIRFFGECQFVYADQPVPGLQTKRMRSLLGYLVLHAGQQLAASHLAFLFWPDSSEKQARTNLRRAFYNLRQVFPAVHDFVARTDHTVLWRADSDYLLDVDKFEANVAQARTTLQSPGQGSASSALKEAIACYRGELLPDCYDDWIAPQRERLRQDFLFALEQMTALMGEEGDYGGAVRYGEILLRQDPLRERSYRTLMELYMLSGDRPAALRTYHSCASELMRELGVEPAAELTALYHRLLERNDRATPQPPLHHAPQLTEGEPLVGRKSERRRLFASWRKAAAGQAGVLLIKGEAGIGKTRLAEELYRWATQLGVAAAQTRAYDGAAALAYAPIVEWLRTPALASRVAALDPDRLTEVARLMPEVRSAHPHLPPPSLLVEDWQRTRLFDALAYAIRGDRAPLLLWLDDLQWCDRESLAWLHYLLHFDPKAPLLVVGTVRTEELEADHPLLHLEHTLRRSEQLTEIELSRLDDDAIMEVGYSVTQGRLGSQELVRHSRMADGNPLFMVEMARASLEALQSDPTGEAPAAAEPTAAQGYASSFLPVKVHSIIRARLAKLSSPAQMLVGTAAAVGRSFTIDLLMHAVDISEGQLVQSLDELWRRRIIKESNTSGANPAYDFSHDRIRDVAYGELSAVRRRYLHRAVAQALETVYAEQLDEWSADIAQHLEKGGNVAAAVRYYRRAGERAAGQFVHHDTVRYATRALALIAADDAGSRYELHGLRERAFQMLADREEQLQELQTMAELAESAGDISMQTDVLLRRADLAEVQGDYEAALALVQQVSDREPSIHYTNQKEQVIAAAIRLGSLYWNLGDYPRAEAQYRRSLMLAKEQNDPRLEATILLHLGALNAYYGPYEEALRISRAALAANRAIGDTQGEIWALNQLGFVIGEQGEDDYAEAQIALLAGLSLARATGNRTYIAKLSNNLAALYNRMGEYDAGLAALEEALAIARATGSARHQAFALNYRGNILVNQGESAEAKRVYRQALARFRTIGYRQGEGKTLSELALVALIEGEQTTALGYVDEARAIAEEIGIKRDQAVALTRMGYIRESQRAWQAAVELYEQARSLYCATDQQRRALEPDAGLARIAHATGDLPHARRIVQQILERLGTRALDATIEAQWVGITCNFILAFSSQREEPALSPPGYAPPSRSWAHHLHADTASANGANDRQSQLLAFCNAFGTPSPLE